MLRDEFASFLSESLEILAREMPRTYARLCATLDGRCVAIEVDAPPVFVSFGASTCEVSPPDETTPTVEAALSKQTVLALIDGRDSLENAVWSDRFLLRAPVDELERFLEGLLLYLRGAVRCPSLPALLDRYRSA
jgi:hypothetical protein